MIENVQSDYIYRPGLFQALVKVDTSIDACGAGARGSMRYGRNDSAFYLPPDKTMLFGKIDTFAIEAMPEPHLQPPSQVWGRMRIWCEGCEIGDFEDPFCGLYTSYMGFHALRDRLSSLWLDEFEGLSDQELWNLLDGALYGYHGDIPLADERSLEEVQRDSARYEPFDFLTNWGEQFDQGGKSFIVYTPAGRVRILNRSLPPARGLALEASLVDVTQAIDGFTAWFEQESERLGEPSVE